MKHAVSTHSDIYLPSVATVLRSEPMTVMERFLEIKLDERPALGHLPGQFVSLSIPGIGEAPISISSAAAVNGTFQVVVRNVGAVTAAIHRLAKGDKIGVRGPFGTHFPVDSAMRKRDILFICGGIGLVPVRSAIQHVLAHRKDYGRVMILSGTRTPAERLFREELDVWRSIPDVTLLETVDRRDQTWSGPEGVITILMPLLKVDPASTTAVICGPPVMYKFVIIELKKMKVSESDIYVSLERHMKCGVGKCGHCQINGLYACQDGPVFRYADIANVKEAI